MPSLPIPRDTAFFFDFDGTLVDLAPTPDGIHVLPQVVPLLTRLSQLSGGALALVSGRRIDNLEAFIVPLVLPIAGSHGAERRNGAGVMSTLGPPPSELTPARRELEQLVRAHPGMLLEDKGVGLALHYRGAPDCADVARDTMTALAAHLAHSHVLQPGKMVYELKPKGIDKGQAIAAFMREAPFAGRRPLFAGDDLTDEKGFEAVNAAGGMSIKIGPGETCANARLESVAALLDWLDLTVRTAEAARS